MERLERITVNPNVCLGQATIRGMRITVSVILKMLATGKSIQEVLEAYPELEAEDVYQAIKYAVGSSPNRFTWCLLRSPLWQVCAFWPI